MTELLMPLLGLRKGRVVFIGSKNANKAGTIELNSFNASLSRHYFCYYSNNYFKVAFPKKQIFHGVSFPILIQS